MANSPTAVVANTDKRWFDHFRPNDQLTSIDEVNFWRPSAQSQFRALKPGNPFFFRLKAPYNAIAGFGFFAVSARMSVELVWEMFGDRNGDASLSQFAERIRQYRTRYKRSASAELSCIVLPEAVFLPQGLWLPWGPSEAWQRNLVSYKRYDLSTELGLRMGDLRRIAKSRPVPDLQPNFELLTQNVRAPADATRTERHGQGTFRLRVLTAYEQQCAVTGEHAVPVLDAAHIQRYLGPASNHPQNGIVLRTDIHRLYDAGYVTVTPDLRLEVSSRLRDEFENGRHYYEMAGRRINVPRNPQLAPSPLALDWHALNVFR